MNFNCFLLSENRFVHKIFPFSASFRTVSHSGIKKRTLMRPHLSETVFYALCAALSKVTKVDRIAPAYSLTVKSLGWFV